MTPDALLSEIRSYQGTLWRVVEGQAKISTVCLTESMAEQEILEAEIERVKPRLPAGVGHLHYLLSTPFRYEPYDTGSRFRRARQKDGVFYASEAVETAIAELAFCRMLFIAESPDMILPQKPLECTAFSVTCKSQRMFDMSTTDLSEPLFYDLTDYTACQRLADVARACDIQIIRYQSVRDPEHRHNLALLHWSAFTCTEPQALQTWHLYIRPNSIDAIREFPRLSLNFTEACFGNDPRLKRA